jgi:predicted permease
MEIFTSTLFCVALLLSLSLGGFVLKKTNLVTEECIPGFSKVLLYVCQPCLIISTFTGLPMTVENLKKIGFFLLFLLIVHLVMLGGAFLVLRKKSKDPIYRVITLATTFTNCAFFAIPLLKALLPNISGSLLVYTSIYGAFMNILGWTVGISIISGDRKYISPKKMLINPAMIGTAVSLLIFFLSVPIHPDLSNTLSVTGNMATPLSMLIMGMRLATMNLSNTFKDKKVYFTVAVKHILMPLVAFAAVFFFTFVDVNLRRTFFIICACPAASVVLNYAEIVGVGQKTAANLVLVSTILSIVTMPFMMLLYPLIR